MKKASIVVGPFYERNRLFDLKDPIANRDDCLFAFYSLKLALQKQGYDLQTHDLHPPEDSDLILYNEMPAHLPPGDQQERSHLLIFESELIRPDNWDRGRHEAFQKIFTWHDGVVDGQRYFKMNFSHKFPSLGSSTPSDEALVSGYNGRDRLATLIAGFKSCEHPLELYSKRVEAIRWFEAHHPEEFDYYGFGWERPYLPVFWLKVARKLRVLDLLPKRPSRSYRGSVRSKFETLRQYRFAICYENARDIPGYITEKIFDCYFAGCVPVYWGARNVTDHLPPETFIDRRKFESYEDLYRFLTSMEESRYRQYQQAIAAFLTGVRSSPFRAESFAKTIANEVVK